jgi:hypothetical protein
MPHTFSKEGTLLLIEIPSTYSPPKGLVQSPLLLTFCLLGRNEKRDREMQEDKAERRKRTVVWTGV